VADYNQHIQQAKKNLSFLCSVNLQIPGSTDWQVTSAFYAAVHLMNARLANIADHHYRSHEKVNDALNPFNATPTALPEDEYLAYIILQNLARRARYLCHHDKNKGGDRAHFTDVNHFVRAITQLDILMRYMAATHAVDFESYEINCAQIDTIGLTYFSHLKVETVAE